jgi:hypothetical protein
MGAVATGLNPHYKPPIMRWNQVEIVSRHGVEFAVMYDSGGLLSIAVRLPGEDWPCDETPKSSNVLAPGEKSFVVTNDERGPAREHEFQPDPSNPMECLICGDQPIIT